MTQIGSIIHALPYKKERVIIINCGTLLCTTLSILSVKKFLNRPLLVIDCAVNNDTHNFAALQKFNKHIGFELLQLPLMPHGTLLDNVFNYLQSDYVCLADSDLEITNESINIILNDIENYTLAMPEEIFGYGFVQCSGFGKPPMQRFFHKERMWIPLVRLNRKIVSTAICNGQSFNICAKSNFNTLSIAQKILKARNFLQKRNYMFLSTIADFILGAFRIKFKKNRIDALHYDTGAVIYEYLKEKGYHFIGYDFYAYPFFCKHYCGVTRNKLYDNEPVSTSESDISSTIRLRLQELYGFEFNEFFSDFI